MPASEIGWSSPPTRGPILQAYGTKRKVNREQDVMTESIQEELSAKRLCTVDMTVGSQIHSQPMQEEQEQGIPFINNNNNDSSDLNFNNNNVQMPSHNYMQSSMEMQAEETVIAVIPPSIEVGAHLGLASLQQQQPPPLAHGVQQAQLDHGMMMDMNGETFTSQSAPEMDAACIVMESDFAPDPHQYHQQQQQQRQENRLPCPTEAESHFCQNYCGAGDESPTSGRVRCFCKPSWEGMMELRPYISDIY